MPGRSRRGFRGISLAICLLSGLASCSPSADRVALDAVNAELADVSNDIDRCQDAQKEVELAEDKQALAVADIVSGTDVENTSESEQRELQRDISRGTRLLPSQVDWKGRLKDDAQAARQGQSARNAVIETARKRAGEACPPLYMTSLTRQFELQKQQRRLEQKIGRRN